MFLYFIHIAMQVTVVSIIESEDSCIGGAHAPTPYW
jgi:hypothetical protein